MRLGLCALTGGGVMYARRGTVAWVHKADRLGSAAAAATLKTIYIALINSSTDVTCGLSRWPPLVLIR